MSETVPSLELTLPLIGVPAVSWAVGAFVILEGVSDIRARDPIAIPAGATARLVQYFAITATAPIFGLIPWLMVSGIEDNFGSPSAPVAALLDALGVAFAWTAVVATGTQAWITRVRLRLFVGLDFGRVLRTRLVLPRSGSRRRFGGLGTAYRRRGDTDGHGAARLFGEHDCRGRQLVRRRPRRRPEANAQFRPSGVDDGLRRVDFHLGARLGILPNHFRLKQEPKNTTGHVSAAARG